MNRVAYALLLALVWSSLASAHERTIDARVQDAVACCGNQDAQDDAPKYGRGYKPLTPEKRAAFYKQSREKHGGRLAMMAKFQDLPPAFDARDKGWVLQVGSQANCGSCYLYSTIYGTMTQAFVKAGYGKADGSFVMAVQYGMDCHSFGGCNGGNGTEVIEWACNNGWYAEKWVDVSGVSHADYPAYEARSRTCRKVAGAKLWKPASWGFVSASQNRPATTLEIKTALYNFGALNVSLDAGGQFGNGSGTITSLGNAIDHEIELIAFDDNHDNGNGTKGAFLLKNQWTTDWGNNGVRWASYAACQHLVDVFFVTAAELPPPPPPIDLKPVITSQLTASGVVNQPFTYQIVASNSPTSYAATGGFTVSSTGLVSGKLLSAGTFDVGLSATNASGTGTATLILTVTSTPIPPTPGGINVTVHQTIPAGEYELHKKGTKAKLDELEKKVSDWQKWWDARPNSMKAEPKESSQSPTETDRQIQVISAAVTDGRVQAQDAAILIKALREAQMASVP